MNNQRIIVTGGSGFIGYNLIKRLLRDGYVNIISVDRNPSNIDSTQNVIKNFSDKETLSKIIKEGDVVVHSACSTVPALSEKERIRDIEENIIGTIRLLDICVEKKIKKFIFISSGGTVYGNNGKKIVREIDNCNPINSHGVMKLTIEKYLLMYRHLYGMNCVIARLSNPYGRLSHGKKNQGIIDVAIEKLLKNEMLEIWGNGEIIRDYIFIEDVADFLVKSIDKSDTCGIFNVGTGIGTSINELLDIIKNNFGKNILVKYSEGRTFDAPYSILSVSKAKKNLEWEPNYTVDQGIKKIYKIISEK